MNNKYVNIQTGSVVQTYCKCVVMCPPSSPPIVYTGGIELMIFSEHFNTDELDVVDVQTQRIDKFGKLSKPSLPYTIHPYSHPVHCPDFSLFPPQTWTLPSSPTPLHYRWGVNYSERGFLLYDGIHYDPLVLATPTGAVLQTMFPTTQEGVVYEALEIAQEAHQVLPNRNAHVPTHKPVVL